MSKQTLRTKIAITFALVCGAALVSVPAFAQGKNPNDGGMVVVPDNVRPSRIVTRPAAPYYGKNLNDGGLAAMSPNHRVPAWAKPLPPRYGRPLNDGGSL